METRIELKSKHEGQQILNRQESPQLMEKVSGPCKCKKKSRYF